MESESSAKKSVPTQCCFYRGPSGDCMIKGQNTHFRHASATVRHPVAHFCYFLLECFISDLKTESNSLE